MSGLYNSGITALLSGDVDLINDDITCIIVDSAYSPNYSSDQNQDDILEAYQLDEIALAGKSLVSGAFDADDVSFLNVTGTIGGVIIYKNTGVESTSTLVAFIDDFDAVPLVADNGMIVVSWSDESTRIFRITSTTITFGTGTIGLQVLSMFMQSILIDDMRSTFFNTDDFAESINYTHIFYNKTFTYSVIFNDASIETTNPLDGSVYVTQPSFDIAITGINYTPRTSDKVIIRGINYYVSNFVNNGFGVYKIYIKDKKQC